jgi:CheY-like chemotaxis protein
MTNREQNLVILVVENSVPVRRLIIENLSKQGVETIEAVDATDAIRILGEKMPNSLVLSNLGKTSAIVFAKELGRLKKTYNLATVLIISDPQMFEEIQKEPLRNSVVPILKYGSIDALTESIMAAYKVASINAESVVVDEQDIQSYASSSEAKQQKIKVKKLNHAYEDFLKVANLVRNDELPGPMMPDVLIKVRRLLSDPDLEFEGVAKFISTHQALSAKIMSLANSVYYSRGNRTTTIKQAILRLGIKEVSKILNAVAALEYIVGKNRQLRDLTALSLSKGYLVGLVGEFLGRITNSSKVNELYIAGLFHNIGSTFMLYTLSLLHDQGEMKK